MSTVKALFVCHSKNDHGESTEFNFSATQGKNFPEDKESQDFAEATPSGQLNIWINNDRPAASFFEQGEEYYLSFEKREK